MGWYDVIVKNGDWEKLAFHGTNRFDAIFAADRIPSQNGQIYIIWMNNGIPSGCITKEGTVINLHGGKPEPYCAADEPSVWDCI